MNIGADVWKDSTHVLLVGGKPLNSMRKRNKLSQELKKELSITFPISTTSYYSKEQMSTKENLAHQSLSLRCSR